MSIYLFIETGVNCGFLSREDSTVVINHQQSIKLAKSEEIDNNFSLFDFPVLDFSAVKKHKKTQGKECYPTKKSEENNREYVFETPKSLQ